MNCHAMSNTNSQNDDLSSLPNYDYGDDLEPKESVLSFSFDHLYAIPDNVTFLQQPKDIVDECAANLDKLCNRQSQAQLEVDSLKTQLSKAKTELAKLKKLASVHLDLIQKQSYLLTLKDKYNKALLLENENLRSKNNRQKQIPPPLVSFPVKPQGSKSHLLPDLPSQHTSPNKSRRPSLVDPTQPSTSGCHLTKKQPHTSTSRSHSSKSTSRSHSTSRSQVSSKSQPPLQRSQSTLSRLPQSSSRGSSSTNRSQTPKSDYLIRDTPPSQGSKIKLEYFSPQGGNDIPIFSSPSDLPTADSKLGIECDFDKTDFDIYSIVKSTSQTHSAVQESTIYGTTAELESIKIKEEALDSDDIFDPSSDNEDSSTPYPKIEKSCSDFSYGESLNNISQSVLSTLTDKKPTASHNTVAWWPQSTTTMVSSSFNDDVHQTHYDSMGKKKNVPKGKGKGKGKKSQPETIVSNHETTNNLIRNMFIATDVSDIPEKISPNLVEEPKVKNRFFRSKLSRDCANNNKTEHVQDNNTVYNFDSHEEPKKTKDSNRNDIDVFDFCMSQQEAEPVIPETPLEMKKKKHIYDPPSDVLKAPKRTTSPSASVYSFEDSQETKMMEKSHLHSIDIKDGKRNKSRAFALFGSEGSDSMEPVSNPVQRVTCYMNAAKGSKKDTTAPPMPSTSSFNTTNPILFGGKRGRRRSTAGGSTVRGTSRNSKARCRANSLYAPNNPTYQRERFNESSSRSRQRAQSAGSHTSAGSRSKSSCDVNLMKLNSELEFKNRGYAMLSHPEYDFLNVGKVVVEAAPPINTLEVPKWRIKTLKPTKLSKAEQEEKLDDIVFAKRHTKMELEEKRIKRWDYQRLKEQLHLKKLKERQEKLNPGGKKILYKPFKQRKVIPQSLWPNSEDVLAIEVVDKLPVSSFGELVPFQKPRIFCPPWLKGKRLHNTVEKKSQQ